MILYNRGKTRVSGNGVEVFFPFFSSPLKFFFSRKYDCLIHVGMDGIVVEVVMESTTEVPMEIDFLVEVCS